MDDEKKKLTALEKAAKEAVRKQMAKEAAQLAKATEQFPAVEGAPEELPAEEVEAPAIAPPTPSQEIAAQQPAPMPAPAIPQPQGPAPATQEGQPEPPPEQLAPEQLAAQQGVSPEYVGNAGREIDAAMLKRLILAHKQAGDQQEATLQGLRRSIPTPDLRAPMAFLDAAIGTDVAKHMPAQMTDEERQLKYAGLEDLISKEKSAGVKNIIDYFKALESSGKYGDIAQTKMRSQDIGLFNKIKGEAMKVNKDGYEFRRSRAVVQDALTPDKNNTVSAARVQMALSEFARLMGEKGVLTDTDVARSFAPTIATWQANIANRLSGDASARLPAESVSAMVEALRAAEREFAQLQEFKRSDVLSQFDIPGSPYHDVPSLNKYRDYIESTLNRPITSAAKEPKKEKAPPPVGPKKEAGPGKVLSPEEWLAKKRAGAQ